MLAISPHSQGFVAEILNFDTAALFDSRTSARVRSFLSKFGLLIIRGQTELTKVSFLQLAQQFGAASLQSDITNMSNDDSIIPPHDYESRRALANQIWHIDNWAQPVPLLGAALMAQTLPVDGNQANTDFLDLAAAWKALPQSRKTWLIGQRTINSYHAIQRRSGGLTQSEITELKHSHEAVEHPAVTLDPISHSPVMAISGHTEGFIGLSSPEGWSLTNDLILHAEMYGNHYSHTWKFGDVLVWNNRRVMHRVSPFDAACVRRRLWRADIHGEASMPVAYKSTLAMRIRR